MTGNWIYEYVYNKVIWDISFIDFKCFPWPMVILTGAEESHLIE